MTFAQTYCSSYESGGYWDCCSGGTSCATTPNCGGGQVCSGGSLNYCKWTTSSGKCYYSTETLGASLYEYWTCAAGCVVTSPCPSCAAGTYITGCSGNSAGTCNTCNTGFYCSGGSAAPRQCEAGYYCAPTGAGSQTICPSGSYSTSNGSTACVPCAARKYGTGAGKTSESTACNWCPDGSSSAPGSGSLSNCIVQNCASGSWWSDSANACIACAAQKYGLGSGKFTEASGCGTCNPGYYCPGNGLQIACPPSSFSAGNASNCSSCSLAPTDCTVAGWYPALCSSVRDSGCFKCPDKPGNSTWNVPTTSLCSYTCANGFYITNTSGLVLCKQCDSNFYCPIGQYPSTCNPLTGMKCLNCTKIPQGAVFSSNSVVGSDNCNWQCVPGYALSFDLNSCNLCSPGTFSNITGSTMCQQCPVYTYSKTYGATSCTQCVVSLQSGMYRSGCGGSSEGTLQQCSNIN